ncbi:MAG: hypothetical protein WCS86_00280 [Candidatus Paceibacterota bacterium]
MNFLGRKKEGRKLSGNILFFLIFFVFIFGLVFFSVVEADFTSTNFKLENPINIISGEQSTSPSFKYLSTTSQLVQGQSTSTNFTQNAGFLYFPIATSPVLSATAGDAQVVLNWTSAIGILANITSYEVGISTSSGGTYTYTSVGNVLTDTKTSLTNGTPYYFKIRSFTAGLLLSESAIVSATPVATIIPPPGGGGGGGGGGVPPPAQTGVIFSGRAYPLSKVSFLKDGQLALSTIAGPDSNFTGSLTNLSAGNYNFSVYGEDKNGLRSTPFSFQVFVTSGATTNISGIFIAPTIAVDKSEVKKGDNIAIFGQSAPSSEIVISINSAQEFFNSAASDNNGIYLHNFDTSVLELGNHSTKSKALKNGEISSFSNIVGFIVGTKNILAKAPEKSDKCDLNEDGRCNLVDFSIAAFWYKKPLSEEFKLREKKHLNGDGKVDLVDFSIMAFYWTG